MIDIKYVEDFSKFYEEHKAFIKQRYSEASALCNTERSLDIDQGLYQKLIEAQVLFVLEILEDEEFIGYCSIAISPALLAQGKVDARVDHLALSEDARAKGYASEILGRIEQLLIDQGADELSISLPPTDLHDGFAERNGYKKSVVTHVKRLEE